jgi:ABC-type cobalamin/Fe3+-siderophores transport system ATPase subunit
MTHLDYPRSLPLDFRHDIVENIMTHISAGDSCSIVGIGSVGKTNLLRFLQQPEVKEKYLNKNAIKTHFLYVDCNKLLEVSRWGVFELLLYQIHQLASAEDSIDKVYISTLYASMQNLNRKKFGIRYLDSALHHICMQQGCRVVFLIDEFDQVYRKLPKKTFSGLRALRDEYKYQLCYVPATRMCLDKIRKPIFEVEGFSELVTPHTIWLGPMSASDANHAIARIARRYQTALSEEQVQMLLKLTGGHPGLLRMALSSAHIPEETLEETLISQRNIHEECYRIFNCLTKQENQSLFQMARGHTSEIIPQRPVLTQLTQKGFIGGDWASSDAIFSTLFQRFLLQENPVAGRRIRIDRVKREVWIDGYKAEGVRLKEYDLLDLLDEHNGEICTYNSIYRKLYLDEEVYQTPLSNDPQIKGVLKRLRKALRIYIDDQNIIETIHGEGLRLNDPEV